jgi:hypothetical protein
MRKSEGTFKPRSKWVFYSPVNIVSRFVSALLFFSILLFVFRQPLDPLTCQAKSIPCIALSQSQRVGIVDFILGQVATLKSVFEIIDTISTSNQNSSSIPQCMQMEVLTIIDLKSLQNLIQTAIHRVSLLGLPVKWRGL